MRDWRGRTVIDRDGKTIGELVQIYLDDRNDEPWAVIAKANDAGSTYFAPLTGASPRGRELRVGVSRRRVYDSPARPAGEQHSVELERELFAHYGRDPGAAASSPRRAA